MLTALIIYLSISGFFIFGFFLDHYFEVDTFSLVRKTEKPPCSRCLYLIFEDALLWPLLFLRKLCPVCECEAHRVEEEPEPVEAPLTISVPKPHLDEQLPNLTKITEAVGPHRLDRTEEDGVVYFDIYPEAHPAS